jgi:hypothetical protein
MAHDLTIDMFHDMVIDPAPGPAPDLLLDLDPYIGMPGSKSGF